MNHDSLENLKVRLRDFAKERDWDQFHSPKNLSMALIAEAGELIEHFQWLTQVKQELGDILIYLVRIADQLGIDLINAAHKKVDLNKKKYPVSEVKGSARKYSEY